MQKIKYFEINGLFGTESICIPIKNDKLVIVGPNGIGKSTVLNIIYYFVSRQWDRLLEYDFSKVCIHLDDHIVEAERDDISGLSTLSEFGTGGRFSPRINNFVQTLARNELLEEFITTRRLSVGFTNHIAELLRMDTREVPRFRSFIKREFSERSLFGEPRLEIEKSLIENITSRVLYLPTYRRIERDLKVVFPDFESQLRRYGGDPAKVEPGRSASHYVELVSFGMEDVRQNLDETLRLLKDYSLAQYNNLSASYLSDVIHGNADKFNAREINSLDDSDLTKILNRVQENSLPDVDKGILRQKIRDIQGQRKSDIPIQEKYLAHYFTKLVEITNDLREREKNVSSFVEVCNSYLRPSKTIFYDETEFNVEIYDDKERKINLSALSSGEKQVVSIFAHLYLDEQKNHVVVIDEPELSLSVPWQRKFLPDIANSGHCDFLIAVTHSPFIFDNELKSYSVDLRKLISEF